MHWSTIRVPVDTLTIRKVNLLVCEGPAIITKTVCPWIQEWKATCVLFLKKLIQWLIQMQVLFIIHRP